MSSSKSSIVLTRASEDNDWLRKQLESLGLSVILAPSLKFQALAIKNEEREHIQAIGQGKFSHLVFTSKTGVTFFKQQLQKISGSEVLPSTVQIAAIGKKTAKICEQELAQVPQIVAEESNARSLVAALQKQKNVSNLLLVKPKKSLPQIEFEFQKLGQRLYKLSCYETIPLIDLDYQNLVEQPTNAAYVFFSPSAFFASLSSFGEELVVKGKIISIGKTTSEAIKNAGFEVWKQASEPSEMAILEIIKSQLASL